MSQFTGTGVAIVTPFDTQGAIDFPALRNIVEHLISAEVEYLVALGTTGESPTLSATEQEAIIDCIAEANADRLPLVLGIGGNNTQVLCEKVTNWTARYQPAGILSVSPYYNKPSQEGLYHHYHAIASQTDVPIILYNVPPRTSSNLNAETTLRLANDCQNIVAIKEASGDLDQIMAIIAQKPDGFEVLSGDDSLALPMISCGAKGIISVTANALPQQFGDMVRACLAGDFSAARTLHYALLPLIALNFAEGNPVGVKAMMHLLGLCHPHVRQPLVSASPDLLERIKKELALV